MYGAPPHVRQSHHDVPVPKINGCTRNGENNTYPEERVKVFEALASLTEALGVSIEQLYLIHSRPQNRHDRAVPGLNLNAWTDRLLHARRVVENIVLFVHELTVRQLGDFWLSIAAFAFSSTTTFLVRLAVQAEISTSGASQSLSLSPAKGLVALLRWHKEENGRELGDICLAQYGDVVDGLSTEEPFAGTDVDCLESAALIPDPGLPTFLDSIIAD